MTVEAGTCIILGDRKTQQDAGNYEWAGNLLLASVCDGMGGMEGGEMASQMGIGTLFELFRKHTPASVDASAEWMRRAFTEADRRVSELTKKDGSSMNAGSTSVVVVTDGETMQWGCVGDSIIYLLRGGQMKTITRMHNYNLQLEAMLQRGEITQQEKELEAVRGEALISFLGIGGLPLIDTATAPLKMQEGDIVILASDGLYKSLDVQQIQAITEESGGNMTIAADRLCHEADRLGTRKQDNTTVIALRFGR